MAILELNMEELIRKIIELFGGTNPAVIPVSSDYPDPTKAQ